MAEKLTWEEMKKKFPDEWLMISDFEMSEYGQLQCGVVLRHSSNKDEVYALPVPKRPLAFRSTGESDYLGFRSYVEHKHTL